MRGVDEWLAEYNDSHRHPGNKLLHWICVPAIMLSLLGLLWPYSITVAGSSLNLAVLLLVAATVYYAMLSWALALGMVIVSVLMLTGIAVLAMLDTPLWMLCIGIFIVAWAGQFIGHSIEGKRPSFFKDVQFLLIGPLWLLSFVYRRLGIRY